jgi:hypothetical protein
MEHDDFGMRKIVKVVRSDRKAVEENGVASSNN